MLWFLQKMVMRIVRYELTLYVSRGAYLYCLKPAWLLHLVVDDRLVLSDPTFSSSREDHILYKEKDNMLSESE